VVSGLQRTEHEPADDEREYAAEQQSGCQWHEFASPVGPIHHGSFRGAQCREVTEHEPRPEAGGGSEQVHPSACSGWYAKHRQGGQCRDEQKKPQEPSDPARQENERKADNGDCRSERGGSDGSALSHPRAVLDDPIGHHARRGIFRVDIL